MANETVGCDKSAGRWLALGVTTAALAVYVATLAPGLTFEHNGVDGGDFIAAARTLGVPHPSGYPTYTLLAWLVSHLPVGTVAYRVNLLSALCAGVTGGLACLSAQILLAASRYRLALSAATGLTLAFSSLLWSQAVIAEVYAMLALFAALLLWLVLSWRQVGGDIRLGNHLTLIFAAPAMLVLLWPERRRWLRAKVLIPAAGLFLAGLCVYVYLPLAASRHPAVNWGDPQTWDRFWWVVSGGPYQSYTFSLGLSQIPGRIAAWIGLLGDQFGWWGLILVVAGIWGRWQDAGGKQRRSSRLLLVAFVAWGLPAGLYALSYATTDSHVYLLPLLVPLALAWGKGADYLLHLAQRMGSLWRRAALAILLLLPLGSLALHWQAADLSHDRTAHTYIQQVLDGAAPGALIVAQGDRPTFALWYGLYADHQRPDLAVVCGPMLVYPWYRDQIRRLYPRLVVPEPSSSSVASGEPVRELIVANLYLRVVYATDPPEAWRAWFSFAEEKNAPLYRVLAVSRASNEEGGACSNC
jgi:Protein O-mannosyl-transferase TMEM260-like